VAPKRLSPLERAATAKRESKYVDFKEKFDPGSEGEWCELLKDFGAMANSGGGVIVVGLRNNGTAIGEDVQAVLDLDPARITDKLFKYTNEHHSGFEVHEMHRDTAKVAVIVVEAVVVPLVFTDPGTYVHPATGKQKTAFSKGTVYFRHGAKSEPATSSDLREFIEARVEAARKAWLGNIRKVVEAPADAKVAIYRTSASDAGGDPAHIQLTTDPNAPVYGRLDPDQSHPYRQKELVKEVNKNLPGSQSINSHDILCLRRTRDINESTRPEFCHSPKFGTMQYSQAFVEWIVTEYSRDSSLFSRARAQYYQRSHQAK
jgi:schlafen family protein